jgi:uncharacterized protein YgiB involved in biofilm formation
MDECGRIQGIAGLPAADVRAREHTEIVVQKGDQAVESRLAPITPLLDESGDVGGRARHGEAPRRTAGMRRSDHVGSVLSAKYRSSAHGKVLRESGRRKNGEFVSGGRELQKRETPRPKGIDRGGFGSGASHRQCGD